ncbi:MAG: hypothetical protein M3468_03465, partial [Acidobacteriota bacterium]|nr:hypothetical protein [Acidobacteriota bacterium]
MTVDDQGRVYIVWAERGFSPWNPDPDDGDARILVTTSLNGASWTEPIPVDNPMTIAVNGGTGQAIPGHQLMPTITFSGGRLMLAYYDFRFDVSATFAKWIDEGDALFDAQGQPRPQPRRRHTVDVRAVQGSPGNVPVFGRSVQVSEYLVGRPRNNNAGPPVQLQFNPPNLPLFKQGGVPFIGDYIDLTASPAFVTGLDGTWKFNTASTSSPLFHVVWTDNRDVVPPVHPKTWQNYTPPTQVEVNSMFTPPACSPGTAGMRNQNIYTARLTGGIVAGAPDNSKVLNPTAPRAFAVYAQNTTEQTRIFRLTIQNQPAGGRAAFTQTAVAGTPDTTSLDVAVARRSTIARTVYVTSTDPGAQVHVSVTEIAAVGAPASSGALETVVVLNPDISNPDISNPDISNPDISNPDISNPDISNPDISNPDISNPDISNPDISNPDISNPDISNPDISNVQVANPDISNPDISNPDISNPDISNPDISNPDISNPDISNQSLTDTTWTLTNSGNTPVAYDVDLLLNGQVPAGIVVQLILHKQYVTPAVVGCSMVEHTTNVLLANILNPQFSMTTAPTPDVNNPKVSNATLVLGAGESARITLRVLDKNIHDGNVFNAAAQVTPAAVSQPQYLVNGVLQHTVTQEAPSRMLTFLQVPTAGLVGIPVDPVVVRATNASGTPAAGATVVLNKYQLGSTTPLPNSLTSTASSDGLVFFNLGPFATPGTYHVIASWTTGGSTVRAQSSNFGVFAGSQPGSAFSVTSTADSGPGTLRQALLSSNGKAASLDTISFQLPANSVIALTLPLPALTDPVVIGAPCTG